MFKPAIKAAERWQKNTGAASEDYASGSRETTKDQSAAAIAAKPLYVAGLQASFVIDSFSKGLRKSGKEGWLKGIIEKGAANFTTGVSSPGSRDKYTSESARYDTARKAADALPRGTKGSAINLARVTAVVNALRAVKTAKS